ncbi:crossover junction endodeoxyribonuclease RuvC [Crassaminicella thermophila]|uniref:Crossover junction endodeoxyribonuclease RuvC n=1 Tax=Crassaminicella thermophila TaxID=2599308 RepID=A0A5C0SD58_CRATE|nr:crossover junction endodeoxyribonuclease RuvC [Crassaminicella thermophila]QEK12060.1 crossover junction endodeoxyribonuclease RuvC [Crassaminicella thermophila]
MIILGIDPGIAILGYGVVEYKGNTFKPLGYGGIFTDAKEAMPMRLKKIYDELQQIIDKYHPDVVAIEELFFNKNVKTALLVGQARGVAILAAANNEIDIYEYTPLQVKQGVVGYGRADKKQVQVMTKTLLNLKSVPKPDDVADALAVAICHAHSGAFGGLFKIK